MLACYMTLELCLQYMNNLTAIGTSLGTRYINFGDFAINKNAIETDRLIFAGKGTINAIVEMYCK